MDKERNEDYKLEGEMKRASGENIGQWIGVLNMIDVT